MSDDEYTADNESLPAVASPKYGAPSALMPVPLDEESEERRAFEAHAPMNTARRDDFPGIYADAFVQASWCGWQARAHGTPQQWLAATAWPKMPKVR